MKCIFNLKQVALLLLLSVFVLNSCTDDDDAKPFLISGSGYIIQKDVNEFIPMLSVISYYYSHPITSIQCNVSTAEGEGYSTGSIAFSKMYTDLYYCTNMSLSLPFNTLPIGTYTIQAQSGQGATTTYNLTIPSTSVNDVKAMSVKLEGEIYITGNDVHVKFNEIPEATAYYVFIQKSAYSLDKISAIQTSASSSEFSWTPSKLAATGWEQSFTLSDYVLSNLSTGAYRVVLAAAITYPSEPGRFIVYQEGAYAMYNKE